MKIYLWLDDQEVGPFTWAEVFVMLQKSDLDESARARIDDANELIPLNELAFWQPGNEVGPFEWDDIALLLREGVLGPETLARFEEDSELDALGNVAKRSNEIVLSGIVPMVALGGESGGRPRKVKAIALIAGVTTICLLGIALFWFGSKSPGTSGVVLEPLPSSYLAEKVDSPSLPKATLTPAPGERVAEERRETPNKSMEKSSAGQAEPVDEPSAGRENTKLSQSDPTGGKTALEYSLSQPKQDVPASALTASPLEKAAEQLAASTTPKPQATPAPVSAPNKVTGDFFSIESIKLQRKEPVDGVAVWKFPMKEKKAEPPGVFVPSLEVRVSAADSIRFKRIIAKAYFFDEKNKLVGTQLPESYGKKDTIRQTLVPVIFHSKDPERLFFPVPEKAQELRWKAVVVWGDSYEVKSVCFPTTETDFSLDYPEKKLVHDRTPKVVERKPAIDPLIEYKVKTRNPKTPEITLFLRPPVGITDSSEIKGVLALSILAGSIDEIKRQLQREEMEGDYNGILGFANKHKLAVLAWGSTSALWNNGNYSDLPPAQVKEAQRSFDMVADAWERGVKELGDKYGIPTKDFLLWGQCGSAHWAHAICLHKPDYFLAIDLHIPGFFEKPTPEAAKVLWCITTGENYGAYQNSLRFVADCKKLGYPMVYKAIIGLGHAGHPDASAMGFEFFEFALSMKELRDQYDSHAKDALAVPDNKNSKGPAPWPEIFQHPPYYGDIVNQVMYPADQVDMIPEGFRIPIPTKEIGAIWSRGGQMSVK